MDQRSTSSVLAMKIVQSKGFTKQFLNWAMNPSY